jgi:hypothetical protein
MTNDETMKLALDALQSNRLGDGQAAIAALQSALAEPSEPVVTDAMIAAYLVANDAYWTSTDKIPTPPDRWRTGTPKEATRAGLEAALRFTRPPMPAPLTLDDYDGYPESQMCGINTEAITALTDALAGPSEADQLLINLGLNPVQYRTDGGAINHMKVKAAILHPQDYPQYVFGALVIPGYESGPMVEDKP